MLYFSGRLAVGVVFCALVGLAGSARAGAHIQFIDMGTPRNGDVVMTGWRGVVVRVAVDGGMPITRIDLLDIWGGMAQRWTDPNGRGEYFETSPGPLPANNTFPSDFNFDSHLLGTAASVTVRPPAPDEAIPYGFRTGRTGLSSTLFVGYGAAPVIDYHLDPIVFSAMGQLGGDLDVTAAYQSDSLDVAYIVTDSAFQIYGFVYTGSTGFFFNSSYETPEPSSLPVALLIMVLAKAQCRRIHLHGGAALRSSRG
jgi:hypothetical protein